MSETRKIAAILVSDVVGYSRLAGTDEDRILACPRGLRSDVIDRAFTARRGQEQSAAHAVAASDAKTTDFGGICREVARADSLKQLSIYKCTSQNTPLRRNGKTAPLRASVAADPLS